MIFSLLCWVSLGQHFLAKVLPTPVFILFQYSPSRLALTIQTSFHLLRQFSPARASFHPLGQLSPARLAFIHWTFVMPDITHQTSFHLIHQLQLSRDDITCQTSFPLLISFQSPSCHSLDLLPFSRLLETLQTSFHLLGIHQTSPYIPCQFLHLFLS